MKVSEITEKWDNNIKAWDKLNLIEAVKEWRVWFRERTGTSYLGSLYVDARTPSEALRKAKSQLSSMYMGNNFKLVIMDD